MDGDSFFAMTSRMKYIERWALMRNSIKENISEHSLEVAMISFALASIGNIRLSKDYDSEHIAMIAMYHDCTEIITGDMPTPVKYENEDIKEQYKKIERMAAYRMLKKLPNDTFDIVLLLGPMYHLFTMEDKLQALSEAKRICKPGGVIFVAYLMNEYGVLTYGFKERHILEVQKENRLDENFVCSSSEKDLYDYVRIEKIHALQEASGLKRKVLFTPDGPANYMRPFLNQLSEEEFQEFIRYVESICERGELIGAAAHTVDVLEK